MTKPFQSFKKARYPNGSLIQGFGESPEIYLPYGMTGHNGVDLPSFYGDDIHAVEGGIVVVATMSPTGFGGEVKILTPSGNEWTYAHLSEIFVKLNDHVPEGFIVGKEGNTGFVVSSGVVAWGNQNPDHRGTHLHLGLRQFVPLVGELSITNRANCLYPNGMRGNILNYDNGTKGAIDPWPLLPETENTKHVFAVDMKYGQTSGEIIELQKRLNVKPTGYFGNLTKNAVFTYQKAHIPLTFYEKYVLRGSVVGPKTRQSLNTTS